AAGFVAPAVAPPAAGFAAGVAGFGVGVGLAPGFVVAEAIVLSTREVSAIALTAAACAAASLFFAAERIAEMPNAAPAMTTITAMIHGNGEELFGVHSTSSVAINFSRSLGEM